jgi:hypothetical protein
VSEDPAFKQNLSSMPSEDLTEWLRIERNVVRDFYSAPREGKPAERARWARDRVKRIEGELRRRSGRVPRSGA